MKLIGIFNAFDESGNQHEIQIWQEEIPAPTRGDPHLVVPGMKQLRTTDGRPVNRESQGVYLIENTLRVTSESPDAP